MDDLTNRLKAMFSNFQRFPVKSEQLIFGNTLKHFQDFVKELFRSELMNKFSNKKRVKAIVDPRISYQGALELFMDEIDELKKKLENSQLNKEFLQIFLKFYPRTSNRSKMLYPNLPPIPEQEYEPMEEEEPVPKIYPRLPNVKVFDNPKDKEEAIKKRQRFLFQYICDNLDENYKLSELRKIATGAGIRNPLPKNKKQLCKELTNKLIKKPVRVKKKIINKCSNKKDPSSKKSIKSVPAEFIYYYMEEFIDPETFKSTEFIRCLDIRNLKKQIKNNKLKSPFIDEFFPNQLFLDIQHRINLLERITTTMENFTESVPVKEEPSADDLLISRLIIFLSKFKKLPKDSYELVIGGGLPLLRLFALSDELNSFDKLEKELLLETDNFRIALLVFLSVLENENFTRELRNKFVNVFTTIYEGVERASTIESVEPDEIKENIGDIESMEEFVDEVNDAQQTIDELSSQIDNTKRKRDKSTKPKEQSELENKIRELEINKQEREEYIFDLTAQFLKVTTGKVPPPVNTKKKHYTIKTVPVEGQTGEISMAGGGREVQVIYVPLTLKQLAEQAEELRKQQDAEKQERERSIEQRRLERQRFFEERAKARGEVPQKRVTSRIKAGGSNLLTAQEQNVEKEKRKLSDLRKKKEQELSDFLEGATKKANISLENRLKEQKKQPREGSIKINKDKMESAKAALLAKLVPRQLPPPPPED